MFFVLAYRILMHMNAFAALLVLFEGDMTRGIAAASDDDRAEQIRT